MTPEVLYILIFTNLVVFSLGLVLGKIYSNNFTPSINDMISIKSKTQDRNKVDIEINDTKYVGKISTEGMEKKYDSLGDIKHSKDDTTASVNKLKNMKGT